MLSRKIIIKVGADRRVRVSRFSSMILALHSHVHAPENGAEVRIIRDQGERREGRDHGAHVAPPSRLSSFPVMNYA